VPFVNSNVLIRLKPNEAKKEKNDLIDVLPLKTGPSLFK